VPGDPCAAQALGDDLLALLTELFRRHGPPDHIRSNNGAEFTAHAVRNRHVRIEVKTLDIKPWAPWEDGHNESFSGKLRDDLLGYQPPKL